jgi:preprotein translocase subunit SecA
MTTKEGARRYMDAYNAALLLEQRGAPAGEEDDGPSTEFADPLNIYARPTTPIRREAPKVGRNDPCPCGSGKKYKKCCGK